jgi:hypothetical protein
MKDHIGPPSPVAIVCCKSLPCMLFLLSRITPTTFKRDCSTLDVGIGRGSSSIMGLTRICLDISVVVRPLLLSHLRVLNRSHPM